MTYYEIVERANAALDAASARCQVREREILRQRAAALDRVPGTHDAVAKHTAALLKASDEFTGTNRKVDTDLANAETQSENARQQAEDDALRAWRRADDEALLALQSDVGGADQAYHDALRQGGIGPLNAPERARVVHEAAIAAANRKYRAVKQADYEAYQQAIAAAFDVHTRSLEQARARSDEAMATARNVRDTASDTADAALHLVLETNPVAASVAAAFDQQLQSSTADCEREKSAILQQMRNDLARVSR